MAIPLNSEEAAEIRHFRMERRVGTSIASRGLMSLLTRFRKSVLKRPAPEEPAKLRVVPILDQPSEDAIQAEIEARYGPERRLEARYRIPNRANVVSWGRKYRARIVDISRNGAAITARANMRIGEKTVLTVHGMGRYRGTIIRHIGDGAAIRFDDADPRPVFDDTAVHVKGDPIPRVDKRQFMRATTTAAASMITGGERINCSLTDLSAGGTALRMTHRPDLAHDVILYIEQLGRMRGRIIRHLGEGVAIEFDVEPSRRDRLAQQVLGLLEQKPA
jgi:hypothetical protein